jgi:hypothetical protein
MNSEFRELPSTSPREESELAVQAVVQHMQDEQSLIRDLLEMAACPERFSRSELSLMLLVAATAIIKREQFGTEGVPRTADPENHPTHQHLALGRITGPGRSVARGA